MARSVKVALFERFGPGKRKKVFAGDRRIAVFNDSGNFFAVGQAAGQGHIWPHILGAALLEQLAEFPNGIEAFAIAQGNGYLAGNFGLGSDAVDLDRVFQKVDMEGL